MFAMSVMKKWKRSQKTTEQVETGKPQFAKGHNYLLKHGTSGQFLNGSHKANLYFYIQTSQDQQGHYMRPNDSLGLMG